ncbi:uncharacterized protein LOC143920494 [Arctopsyche grandis]|uniref:uncharacterized protein LOC143920494 n=1 Tax=Arctopsyche grandis TaxID=121162 RepID=UPI00406D895D
MTIKFMKVIDNRHSSQKTNNKFGVVLAANRRPVCTELSTNQVIAPERVRERIPNHHLCGADLSPTLGKIAGNQGQGAQMKSDIAIRAVPKWRGQSPGVKSAPRKVLAVKMNNFFDEKPSDLETETETWPLKSTNNKKRPRPLTATLAKPRLLDITLLGKIDMSLMRKELLSVYRLMKMPIERLTVADKKLSMLKKTRDENGPNGRKSFKKDIVIEITDATETENSVIALRKDKSPFKLFPGGKQRNRKVDAAFSGPAGQLLAKPCDSCGRASRPERLHAHPHRVSLSPTRIKLADLSEKSTCDKNRKFSAEVLSPIHPKCVKKEGKQSPSEKQREAPPICSFCGRRFGTSSLPIHEAKCRERLERKSNSFKITQEDLSTPRELYITPRKTSSCSNPVKDMSDRDKIASPRKLDLQVEKIENSLVIPGPGHRARLSPNKERVPAMTASRYPQTDSGLEDLSLRGVKDSDVEWTTHLRSLVKCSVCDRAFAPERVLRHQSICNGSSKRTSSNNKPRSLLQTT